MKEIKKFIELETIKSLSPEQINNLLNEFYEENQKLKKSYQKLKDEITLFIHETDICDPFDFCRNRLGQWIRKWRKDIAV